MKVLVTGGVRSGKSAHAEGLLVDAPAVTYVAPGPTATEDADPDWAARVAAHVARRPAHWRTVESRDLAAVLTAAEGAVLVDCLGTWLTAWVDAGGWWDAPSAEVAAALAGVLAPIEAALRGTPYDVVLVSNEVGLGVVPAHRSGRLFRDLLGTVNQRLAAACDGVHLVIAGRVLPL